MKITQITRVKKSDHEQYLGTVSVNQLIEYLNDTYVKQGKGDERVRANIPGQGWVYLSDISEVLGEVYLGLPLDEAEEMELSMKVDEAEKEETKEETPKTESKKESK